MAALEHSGVGDQNTEETKKTKMQTKQQKGDDEEGKLPGRQVFEVRFVAQNAFQAVQLHFCH